MIIPNIWEKTCSKPPTSIPWVTRWFLPTGMCICCESFQVINVPLGNLTTYWLVTTYTCCWTNCHFCWTTNMLCRFPVYLFSETEVVEKKLAATDRSFKCCLNSSFLKGFLPIQPTHQPFQNMKPWRDHTRHCPNPSTQPGSVGVSMGFLRGIL